MININYIHYFNYWNEYCQYNMLYVYVCSTMYLIFTFKICFILWKHNFELKTYFQKMWYFLNGFYCLNIKLKLKKYNEKNKIFCL